MTSTYVCVRGFREAGRHFDAVTAPMITAYHQLHRIRGAGGQLAEQVPRPAADVQHPARRGHLGQGEVRGAIGDLVVEPATPALLIAFGTLGERGHITIPGHTPILASRPSRRRASGTLPEGCALPELTTLHRSLLGWLATADAAGLDEDGIVALFTSALRDFRERRSGTEGVA